MNTTELASLIFDAQPDTLHTDELIAVSALPDAMLVRSYYANPQNGHDLLADFSDGELDLLFGACNDLTDASTVVAKLASERPLTAEESHLVRDRMLRLTVDMAIDIANQRRVDGFPLDYLKPI